MSIKYLIIRKLERIWYRKIKPTKHIKTKPKIGTYTDTNYDWRADDVRIYGGSKTYYLRLPSDTEKQKYFEYLIDKQNDWKYDFERGRKDWYYKSEYQRYIGKCPLCGNSIWREQHKYFRNTDNKYQHSWCAMPEVENKEEAIKKGFMDKDNNLLDTAGKIIGKLKG